MTQWLIPLEDILQLWSNDFDCGMEALMQSPILRNEMEGSVFWHRVSEVMEREDINLIPVFINGEAFINGHHRVQIAYDLGLDFMLVTDDREESEWEENNFKVKGWHNAEPARRLSQDVP